MIDSQGGPERERLGMTWTLFLFISPGKGALTHHPPLAGGGMALRPPGDGGWGGSAVPRAGIYSRRQRRLGHRTPLLRYTGAWAPSATNKLRRVYTEALLATTVNVRQKRLNIVRISGIIYHINLVNGVYQAILENEKTGIGDMGK